MKSFWRSLPQKTFATDTEPITAKMIFGEDAQELVVCQARHDFFAVTLAGGKAVSTHTRQLTADGSERQKFIIEAILRGQDRERRRNRNHLGI